MGVDEFHQFISSPLAPSLARRHGPRGRGRHPAEPLRRGGLCPSASPGPPETEPGRQEADPEPPAGPVPAGEVRSPLDPPSSPVLEESCPSPRPAAAPRQAVGAVQGRPPGPAVLGRRPRAARLQPNALLGTATPRASGEHPGAGRGGRRARSGLGDPRAVGGHPAPGRARRQPAHEVGDGQREDPRLPAAHPQPPHELPGRQTRRHAGAGPRAHPRAERSDLRHAGPADPLLRLGGERGHQRGRAEEEREGAAPQGPRGRGGHPRYGSRWPVLDSER